MQIKKCTSTLRIAILRGSPISRQVADRCLTTELESITNDDKRAKSRAEVATYLRNVVNYSIGISIVGNSESKLLIIVRLWALIEFHGRCVRWEIDLEMRVNVKIKLIGIIDLRRVDARISTI